MVVYEDCIKSKMWCLIAELESVTIEEGSNLESFLKGQLTTLNDVLSEGDEVPESMWDRLENLGIF